MESYYVKFNFIEEVYECNKSGFTISDNSYAILYKHIYILIKSVKMVLIVEPIQGQLVEKLLFVFPL